VTIQIQTWGFEYFHYRCFFLFILIKIHPCKGEVFSKADLSKSLRHNHHVPWTHMSKWFYPNPYYSSNKWVIWVKCAMSYFRFFTLSRWGRENLAHIPWVKPLLSIWIREPNPDNYHAYSTICPHNFIGLLNYSIYKWVDWVIQYITNPSPKPYLASHTSCHIFFIRWLKYNE
jgi:hypothetical protein